MYKQKESHFKVKDNDMFQINKVFMVIISLEINILEDPNIFINL